LGQNEQATKRRIALDARLAFGQATTPTDDYLQKVMDFYSVQPQNPKHFAATGALLFRLSNIGFGVDFWTPPGRSWDLFGDPTLNVWSDATAYSFAARYYLALKYLSTDRFKLTLSPGVGIGRATGRVEGSVQGSDEVIEVLEGSGPSFFAGTTLDFAFVFPREHPSGEIWEMWFYLYFDYRYVRYKDEINPVGDANLFFPEQIDADFSTHFIGVGIGVSVWDEI
jgi:hypothetical protein